MKNKLKLIFIAIITTFLWGLSISPNLNLTISQAEAECNNSNCGGGRCPGGCPGLVTMDYGGCFKGDNAGSLYCDSTTDQCTNVDNQTVPCPEDCPPPCDCDEFTNQYCSCSQDHDNAGCNLSNAWSGVCFDPNTGSTNGGCINEQYCTVLNDGSQCYETKVEIYCCDTPAPTQEPQQPEPTTEPGQPTNTPAPTPTTAPRAFEGTFYNDENATVSGLGGSDNLCTGSTADPIFGFLDADLSVEASRTGESATATILQTDYLVNVSTSNSDYTIELTLAAGGSWQCACNAVGGDPYRCRYTNQQPSDTTDFDFFLKPAGAAEDAWFQTLGGSSWAENNIVANIPATTCTPPTCTPALIASDPSGNSDSAGFPLTNEGRIVTSYEGETYIHESDARSTAVQAQATGVEVPIENYDYFYDKVGEEAETLVSSDKPTVGTDLTVYEYSGNLTIDETSPWNLTNTEKIIVFVDGNMTIDDTTSSESRIITVDEGGDAFLMFAVSGDLTITENVGYSDITTDPTQADIANVEGVFVSDGTLTIAGVDGTTDNKFIGAGTFVGWTGVSLERNFDDGVDPTLNNNAATETFIFRPDLLVNAPKAVKSAQMTWREVEPSF